MKTVKVKDIIFNEGLPKICVPLVGKTKEDILKEGKYLHSVDFDLVEFRVDFYEDVEDFSNIKELLKEIRKIYNRPLLFTFRTKKEGGEHEMPEDKYFELNHVVIESGLVDLVDVELFSNEDKINNLIAFAKENDVKVIMSNHDIHKTPPKEEIINRLVKMQEYGADITKIAVMPRYEEDVLTLLNATLEMKRNKRDRPTITISMGQLGIISRLACGLFGSCMTFAAAKKASAPGQINVKDMRNILNLMNRE
ncbi:type I 3-dehydroquinate dehydratase [Clostridium sp. D2Q-14]|uniref:type I 3-dehydroquinate dehydratase n=1 Tax=Anaeromonas gelatinilytica TaxID=2683194 RepID=UPI00193B1E13|nr:type I 3-dehydroquinate dehydratase [Anaeromonas gelatinilytica]MBS4536464.1 type I 3-dehydroquinate dehydratase [Anaeromonas gelatinilytica]